MAKPTKTKEAAFPADQAQLDRFKQTARELGCDETGKAFETAFKRVVPPKRPPSKIPPKSE